MKYEVWCPDLGSGPEDARTFDAHSNYAAAEAWANWEDGHSADYWIVGGQTARVCVRDCGGTTVHEFVVSGEMAREYRARPVTANVEVS